MPGNVRWNRCGVSGKNGGAKPIGYKVCSGTGGAVQNTGTREMDDAKGFSLGERQFLDLAFALIGFRLTVGCAGELIVRLKRAGRPLAKAIIRIGRAQELHRADREQKEKQPVPGETNHELSPQKSDHRTMSRTLSAIPCNASQRAQPDQIHKSISPINCTIPCCSRRSILGVSRVASLRRPPL